MSVAGAAEIATEQGIRSSFTKVVRAAPTTKRDFEQRRPDAGAASGVSTKTGKSFELSVLVSSAIEEVGESGLRFCATTTRLSPQRYTSPDRAFEDLSAMVMGSDAASVTWPKQGKESHPWTRRLNHARKRFRG